MKLQKGGAMFQVKKGMTIQIGVGKNESPAVCIAVENLRRDLGEILDTEVGSGTEIAGTLLRIGTVGVSPEMLADIDTDELRDADGNFRKEAYLQTVKNGVLTIAGTDRRGTIYGVYDFCEKIGVSPWYFWADVPIRQKEEISLPEGYHKRDYPSVEYRGIFLNDEEELERWAQLHMGEDTIGIHTYEKVFELILRLKGNYIWPAMHVNSFNLKKENGALADRMGIVVGTSHCDMLMRSNNREWIPWITGKGYTDAQYDYSIEGRNREILDEYWRESVQQNKDFEVSYTLGMRGIHDSGFETRGLRGGTAEEIREQKIQLLETIIGKQRQILQEELEEEPLKLFIPYKEVLELYDHGLKVPEEMTMVWANDNYGYIRRYPSAEERKRPGGHGIYYHNSYWSPPGRSYLFLCSTPLAHTKYELMKAYQEGIRKLWVLNVGALKPLEMEVEFFLRLAWEAGKVADITDTDAADINTAKVDASGSDAATIKAWDIGASKINMTTVKTIDMDVTNAGTAGIGTPDIDVANTSISTADIDSYIAGWIDRNFTGGIGKELGSMLACFSQTANVRKLEMMEDDVFSQTSYGDEGAVRLHKLRGYLERAEKLYAGLPEEEKDAFFQLVLFRLQAVYLTMAQYYFSDRSVLCCRQGKQQAAGVYAKEMREYEDARRKLLVYYNKKLHGGKWDGLVTPEDFPPPRAAMYPAAMPSLQMGERKMLVHLWNDEEKLVFVKPQEKWFEISNGGEGGFDYSIEAPEWLELSETSGYVETERRILVRVKEGAISPEGDPIAFAKECAACGKNETADNTAQGNVLPKKGTIYIRNKSDNAVISIGVEFAGYVDMSGSLKEVENCEDGGAAVISMDGKWAEGFRRIPRLGREEGSLLEGSKEGAQISFPVYLTSSGNFLLEIHRFPSLNSIGRIRIGVIVDGGDLQVVESGANDEKRGTWVKNITDNVDKLFLELPYLREGMHTITLQVIDRYFALSKMVIYTRERKYSMLGPVQGSQELLEIGWVRKWADAFYGEIHLKPRKEIYAAKEYHRDSTRLTDCKAEPSEYASTVKPEEILGKAFHIFAEEKGAVKIDAVTAYRGTPYAYAENGNWQYCCSESYGRSGLAIYIREKDRRWENPEEAPRLNYKISCSGGNYTLWVLTRIVPWDVSRVGVAVDGEALEAEELYNHGKLWRYEAEQVWRWVPLASLALETGEHLLTITTFVSGIRLDRIYLTKGTELPPVDAKWEVHKDIATNS